MAQPNERDKPGTAAAALGSLRFSAKLKRAGLAVLFGAVLLIPRIRRLRRKVLPWTLVRIFAAVAGAWSAWTFARSHAGVMSLLLGIGLLAFGVFVRSRPERKSLDDIVRELGGLVALNGGVFLATDGAKPIPSAQIVVGTERMVVLSRDLQQVAVIPLNKFPDVSARLVPARSKKRTGGAAPEGWEVTIAGAPNGPLASRFRYEGIFAEHLARVAEQTIRSVLKKQLPVLKS